MKAPYIILTLSVVLFCRCRQADGDRPQEYDDNPAIVLSMSHTPNGEERKITITGVDTWEDFLAYMAILGDSSASDSIPFEDGHILFITEDSAIHIVTHDRASAMEWCHRMYLRGWIVHMVPEGTDAYRCVAVQPLPEDTHTPEF